jgi:hypothetical protein
MSDVIYETKEVELSRKYPFGESKKIDDREVTVLTVKELNGFDDETISKQVESGKLAGYVQLSVSAGLTYDEVRQLANKDSAKAIEALANL